MKPLILKCILLKIKQIWIYIPLYRLLCLNIDTCFRSQYHLDSLYKLEKQWSMTQINHNIGNLFLKILFCGIQLWMIIKRHLEAFKYSQNWWHFFKWCYSWDQKFAVKYLKWFFDCINCKILNLDPKIFWDPYFNVILLLFQLWNIYFTEKWRITGNRHSMLIPKN